MGAGLYRGLSRAQQTTGAHSLLTQDLVGSGALVSIANKYGETPIDKAKTPLREVLKGSGSLP